MDDSQLIFEQLKNQGILDCLRVIGQFTRGPLTCHPSQAEDPYYLLGTHPDLVEVLWDKLTVDIPVDTRWILHARPVWSTRKRKSSSVLQPAHIPMPLGYPQEYDRRQKQQMPARSMSMRMAPSSIWQNETRIGSLVETYLMKLDCAWRLSRQLVNPVSF